MGEGGGWALIDLNKKLNYSTRLPSGESEGERGRERESNCRVRGGEREGKDGALGKGGKGENGFYGATCLSVVQEEDGR